jgi:hypothetical protein
MAGFGDARNGGNATDARIGLAVVAEAAAVDADVEAAPVIDWRKYRRGLGVRPCPAVAGRVPSATNPTMPSKIFFIGGLPSPC